MSVPNSVSTDLSGLRQVYDALCQAQDCIRGETPEDVTEQEAREDTIDKVRDAMRIIEGMGAGGPAQGQPGCGEPVARIASPQEVQGTYLYEPAERGRLCVIRYKGPHYTGCGDVVARNVELDMAQRIVALLNGPAPQPLDPAGQIDRSELVAMLQDLASVNLSREAAERQAGRMADALIALCPRRSPPSNSEAK